MLVNVSAGPSALDACVVQQFVCDVQGGRKEEGILETLHRGEGNRVWESWKRVEQSLRRLLHVPERFSVLPFNDGASIHFASVPLNFHDWHGMYHVYGHWSRKAEEESRLMPHRSVWSLQDTLSHPARCFLHYCDNETIEGKRVRDPKALLGESDALLVGDHSSSLLTRDIDWDSHLAIYASGSKNLGGGGGSSVVFVDASLQWEQSPCCPKFLSYRERLPEGGFFNTPNAGSIRLMDLHLQRVEQVGGLEELHKRLTHYSCALYAMIDSSMGFVASVPPEGDEHTERSMVNIVFDVTDRARFECIMQDHCVAYYKNRLGPSYRVSLTYGVLLDERVIGTLFLAFQEYIDQMSLGVHEFC